MNSIDTINDKDLDFLDCVEESTAGMRETFYNPFIKVFLNFSSYLFCVKLCLTKTKTFSLNHPDGLILENMRKR